MRQLLAIADTVLDGAAGIDTEIDHVGIFIAITEE